MIRHKVSALCILAAFVAVVWQVNAMAQGPAVPVANGAVPTGESIRICIDPGHPSEVGRGTTGKHISEMTVNWLIANRLSNYLLRAHGVQTVLTKSRETEYVTNQRRAEIANLTRVNLMVRLHCDGGNGIGSGFAVYYPTQQGRSGTKTGPSRQVIAESSVAAHVFYRVLARDLSGEIAARGLHSDTATRVGAMHGALIGSIYSEVPVVLVEMCVLTNPKDEAWIMSQRGQTDMARALADASRQAALANETQLRASPD